MKLSDSEINSLYYELKKYHEEYLEKYRVTLPNLKWRSNYTKKALVLVYLFKNFKKVVTKNELTEFLDSYGGSPDVQEARHLGQQDGWFVISGKRKDEQCEQYNATKSGDYALISVKKPYPDFTYMKRETKITNDEWENLKKEYDYRCATCGSIEGQNNLHYPNIITSLQKGHMDPNKELKIGNIIPQCSECNRQDRNYFIYNKKGRVVKIADPSFVRKSDKKTKNTMLKILKEDLNID